MPAFSMRSRSNSNSRNGRCRRSDLRVTSWLSGSRRTSPTRMEGSCVARVTDPVRCPAQHGPDPGHQFSRAKGQCEVVVSPGRERVRHQVLVVRADEEDRETGVLGPQLLAEGQAVSFEAAVDYGDVGPA